MKSLKLSPFVLSLITSCAIVICQSCSVYAPPVAIEKAIDKGRVKIKNADHRSIKYHSLVSTNGQILGVIGTTRARGYEQIPGNVRYVQVKDRAASAVLTTVAIISGGIIIAAPIIALNSLAESLNGMSIGGGGGGWCLDPSENRPVLRK